MIITTDQRSAVDEARAEAHRLATRPDGSVSSAAAASHFVRLLREIEGADPAAVGAYLDALTVRGAKKVLSDWRRSHRLRACGADGTALHLPRFAGTRRATDDGRTEHVQTALTAMSIDELRSHKDRLCATRDTLSAEVRLVDDLIAVCEAEGYATAGQAIDHLIEVAG